MHKGRVFQEPDGLSLGPGPFVLALEHASGKVATVVGKPQAAFFASALADVGCSPGEAVMIGGWGRGMATRCAAVTQRWQHRSRCTPHPAPPATGDDVRDDVGGAQAAALRGILVQTGKYRAGDEANAGVAPAATCADFAAAVEWVLQQNAAAAAAEG